MSLPPYYVVVVSNAAHSAEALCSTDSMWAALHAIDVFLLFAPDARVSLRLYTNDPPYSHGCVLRVEGGVWKVQIPAALREAVA